MSSIICGRCAATASHSASTRGSRLLAHRVSTSTRNSRHQIYSASIQTASRRHASSSKSRKSHSPPPTVNPPLTTLPAELNLPPSRPSTATEPLSKKFSRIIAIGRAYLAFYKTGLKNVYFNYKTSLPIRRALGLPSYLPTSPPPSATRAGRSSGATSFKTAIDTLQITRADFQLVRRAAYDVRRMIPFGLLLIICGEFTPLIVAAVGDPVTPFTCRIPRQVSKTRATREHRKICALRGLPPPQGGPGAGSVTTKTVPAAGSVEEMRWLADQFATYEFATTASPEQVLRACAVFGLAKTHDRPSFLVPLVYRPRLVRWAEYLELDDRLIVNGGGVRAMSAAEVRIAVDERGGVNIGSGEGLGGSEKEERRWLSEWLVRRKIT